MNNISRTFLTDLNNNNKRSLLKATCNYILSHWHIFSFTKYYDVLIFIITYLYMLRGLGSRSG
jgi:hypothetical protein